MIILSSAKPERRVSAAELHEVACYYGLLKCIIKPYSSYAETVVLTTFCKNDKLTITKNILTYTKTILSKIKFQGGIEVCSTQQPYKI